MNYVLLNEKKVYPSKVVCLGRNYVEHIKELSNDTPEEMVFFIKPNSSISQGLIFPKKYDTCHFESEISFLIEKNKISAVAFGLDLTLRDVQSKLKKKGLPWERAKAFDKSAVFSKFISINEIDDLELELYLNGRLQQKGDISMMINKPLEILKEAQTFLTFEDNDILMTGTPKGVGEFKLRDEFNMIIKKQNKVIINNELIVM